MPATVGQPAPDFTLRDTQNNEVSLSDFKGSKLIVAFLPNPNTGICNDEACALRDDYSSLSSDGSKVVIITCHARPLLGMWVEQHNIQFPVLSDFWPHGAIAQAYGCFDNERGIATRTSYVIDAEGIVREIIQSGSLGEARDHSAHAKALAAI